MANPRSIIHLSQNNIDEGRTFHVTLGELSFLQSIISNYAISATSFHLSGSGTLSADGSILYWIPDSDPQTPLIIAMY